MSTEAKVDFGGIVFRNTNAGTGRQLAVTPENSAMKHLAYARVILNSATPVVSLASGGRETALICLSGRADVKTDGQEFQLGRFDGLYIPRDSFNWNIDGERS
jgi:5-deoxy-D-glucuronate isomerase